MNTIPDHITIDNKFKNELLSKIYNTLVEMYVFPEKGKEYAKHLEELREKGEFDKCNNLGEFVQAISRALVADSGDHHLALWPWDFSEDDDSTSDEEMENQYQEELRKKNYRFMKLENLPGNIGYLKLDEFARPKNAGKLASAAMEFLSGSSAVIIDLLDNGGGDGALVLFIQSYFFRDEPIHISGIYDRKEDKEMQFWTLPYVPGKRMPDVPLYVLISKSTFSAGEDFAYNLQAQGRAVIIGENTRGGAHPIDYCNFKEYNTQMMIPIARSTNPITNTNWQGVGVKPDIEADSYKALDIAYEMALDKLIENEKDDKQLFRLKWAREELQAAHNTPELPEELIEAFTGKYGGISITYDGRNLLYQRGERRIYKMVYMGNNTFSIYNGDERIEFTEIKAGKAQKIIRSWDTGQRYTVKRSS